MHRASRTTPFSAGRCISAWWCCRAALLLGPFVNSEPKRCAAGLPVQGSPAAVDAGSGPRIFLGLDRLTALRRLNCPAPAFAAGSVDEPAQQAGQSGGKNVCLEPPQVKTHNPCRWRCRKNHRNRRLKAHSAPISRLVAHSATLMVLNCTVHRAISAWKPSSLANALAGRRNA